MARFEPSYEVIPADENGIYLSRALLVGTNPVIELIKLDTGFNRNWHGHLNVDKNFELMGKRTYKDNLHLLFRHRDILRKDLQLYVIGNENGMYTKHIVRNFIPFVPTDFQVNESCALIGGYYNQIPVVIYYSLKLGQSKILPGLLNEQGELSQVQIHEDGTFDVLISARGFKRSKTIWIKTYDPDGNLLYQTPIETEGNKSLLFARSVKTGSQSKLIAGTYGHGTLTEYTKGIFIANIDPGGYQQVKYYSYADLSNFFKYLKATREKRIKDRIERRKVKGKITRFNYRFIVHEIVPYNNQFVLLGEAFYPKYVTSDPRYGMGFFSSSSFSYMQNGRRFDGFRYTHAGVMGFDKNGRLLWDNSFEINDIKTFTLDQFVKLEMQDDKIALLYLFENKIRTKLIQGDEVVEGKSIEPIRTFSDNHVTKNERYTGSKMNYWYSDFFYACGVQQIADANGDERRVFFVNKVTYRSQGQQ